VNCPECEHSFTDDMRGIVKCPNCLTRSFISFDKLTGEKEIVVKEGFKPARQVNGGLVERIVKRVEREAKEIHCVSCSERILTAFFHTGKVIHGVEFAKRNVEVQAPILGFIETPFGNHVIGGQMEQRTKSFGFLKTSKGPLCNTCAADHRVIETKDGWLPRVKTDACEGVIGTVIVPTVERRFDEVAPKGPSPTSEDVTRRAASQKDNQWLNVGRRK
jgi:hypothetical protein